MKETISVVCLEERELNEWFEDARKRKNSGVLVYSSKECGYGDPDRFRFSMLYIDGKVNGRALTGLSGAVCLPIAYFSCSKPLEEQPEWQHFRKCFLYCPLSH